MQKWGLGVNVNKTKTMVLSKGNMKASFRINQSSIENVDNYEYLGFQLRSNGSFSRLITDRIDKATRVSHMVLQALRVDQNVSPRLSLSLFDKQIVPILLYGAAVWSAPRTHNFIVQHAGLLWSQQDFEWRWSVPLFKCLTVLEFSFILFDLCLLITFFNFIMNYVPIVTFWIFTYHKIWILSIMFCFIWSYWIIYFLACLEVSWRVVS